MRLEGLEMNIYGICNQPGSYLEIVRLRHDGWVKMEYLPKTAKIKSLYTRRCDINSLYLIRRVLEYDEYCPYYIAPFLKEDLEGGFFDVEKGVDNWTSIV